MRQYYYKHVLPIRVDNSVDPAQKSSSDNSSVAPVSVYVDTNGCNRVMFTLSGDNVQYHPLLSTFNEKTKIKKYNHIFFSQT